MTRAFNRLQRVLELEGQQGYQNKAVVGGIRQFAVFWVEQARAEATDELDQALVEQVGEVLLDYGRLPGPEARQKAIQNLQDSLQRRQKRLGASAPSAAKPAPPPPKRKQPSPPPPSKPAAVKEAIEETDEELEEIQPEAPQERKRPSTPPTLSQAEPDPAGLAQPTTSLKGIGPKIAQSLEKLGAQTIWDLLFIFPRRYDDYTLMKPIKDLVYGEQVTVIGTVWQTSAKRIRGSQVMVQSMISDGSGTIQVTWFNQPWLAEKLKAGMQVVISGKVDQFLGRLVFNSPEWEPLEMDPLKTRRIVPVYPLTAGLNSNRMRDIMQAAVSHWSPRVPEPLPADVRRRQDLYSLPQAISQTHFPESQDTLFHARRRLIFDELFLLQLGMQGFRRDWQAQPGLPLLFDLESLTPFYTSLPFALTGAQQRVIGEIAADLARSIPMNRLLQGDVGSGKTVVAAAAMLMAAKAGAQAALMAPTEILAEQHYQGLSKLLTPLGVNVCLLTGSTPAAEKTRIYAELADGTIHVATGTHALIQPGVQFHTLALSVIDEQHRFGVDQRQALRDKGAPNGSGVASPHVLVMSATPIPRTLALSLYGDLDLSLLDEMPPGRQEIKTRWLRSSERERAYSFVRRQVKAGRQAYIIYPLVEESDKIDAKAAVAEHERLQTEVFPDLRVGLIHGRLKSDEKEAAMRAFYSGDSHILVATSVIEVGVDVPNSTVMVIEGANRFGLAQLHQFRGRVGRGEHQSYCLLIADNESAEAEERLSALEKTNDGFVLAEKDLEIRGPGEFFGRRQSGIPELRLASLLDMEMLTIARSEAELLFHADPNLEEPQHRWLAERVHKFWEQAGDVS
ncbi:MAG: ATP-dependent DNA helicase RecG [Chloroflexi bacterium]|nr:ATP-dependent DNA helicase RecG [Chloroflexota bacterium]